jgi:hypothetical protein
MLGPWVATGNSAGIPLEIIVMHAVTDVFDHAIRAPCTTGVSRRRLRKNLGFDGDIEATSGIRGRDSVRTSV